MRSQHIKLLYCIIFLFLLPNPVFAGGTSNKWRIEVDGGANSDGEMMFNITPIDGEAIVIHVEVKDGTGENRVAKTIRDAFKEQLPEGHYKIEVDDGEDVIVKKKGDTKNFGLTLVTSTVRHTKIDIEKE